MKAMAGTIRMRFSTVFPALLTGILLLVGADPSGAFSVCSRSAILIDASNGSVLYEQDADEPIAPASVTKIMTLYLVFDAIKAGEAHPWDRVPVSKAAASTGGSRMGLRAGTLVPLEELIQGIAVVSGNDAAVAVAEYLSGTVDQFVMKMNHKARELGMHHTFFKTPNGLPAKGQLSTARDLAKLSLSYIRHYPEALHIHSMTSYTYNNATHRNANRLLGTCPGVDGIKTGFVCASGYNLAATAKRGDVRLIAVVMGARSACVRANESEKLLEAGFQKIQAGGADHQFGEGILARAPLNRGTTDTRSVCALPRTPVDKKTPVFRAASASPVASKLARPATLNPRAVNPVAGRSKEKEPTVLASKANPSKTAIAVKSGEAARISNTKTTAAVTKKRNVIEGSEPPALAKTPSKVPLKRSPGQESKTPVAKGSGDPKCSPRNQQPPQQALNTKPPAPASKKKPGQS